MLKFLALSRKKSLKKLEAILNTRKFKKKNQTTIIKKILDNVKKKGDQAVIKYEIKFSNIKNKSSKIKFSNLEINKISKKIDVDLKRSIDTAYERIINFHSKQKITPFKYKDKFNNELSYVYSAIDRVAVYVPGGTAGYPSTVLMNCIPAKVAGVKNIYLTTPALGRNVNQQLSTLQKNVV